MKHFTKLGLNSKVIGVTHVNDTDASTEEFTFKTYSINPIYRHPLLRLPS
jgi:hypothetical protein